MSKRGLTLEAFDDAYASRTRYSHAFSAPWKGNRAVYAYTGREGQIITELVKGVPENIDTQVNSLLESVTNSIEGTFNTISLSDGQARFNGGTASVMDGVLDLLRRNVPFIGSDKWAVYSIRTPQGQFKYIPCVAYLGAQTSGKVGSPDEQYFWVFREDKVGRVVKVIWHVGSDTLSIMAISGCLCGGDGGTGMMSAGPAPVPVPIPE